jgi:SAM-dependent methyltransferase
VFDDLREVSAGYRRRANQRVREWLPPEGRFLLDAASGAIQYEDYARFSEGYRRRVCVDLSRRGLLAARRRIGGHGLFIEADVTQLPFRAGAFDGVVSLHTLYHVPADEQPRFLLEVARVLRAGRRAVVVSTWTSSPWDRALRLLPALGRRLQGALRRVAQRGAADRPPSSAGAVDLYFHPTRREWLKASVPAGTRIEIRCWRSVSVEFLRLLPDGRLGAAIVLAVTRLENVFPRLLGRLGVYPLLTLEKDA